MSDERASASTDREMPELAGQAPGVVKVRLSGAPTDISAVAAVLAREFGVLERSAPYPNRRDRGVRVYLTVQTGGGR